jgi:hypothetical protein
LEVLKLPAKKGDLKNCPVCKLDLPLDKFHKCKQHLDGLQYNCIDCQRKRHLEYAETNGDLLRAKARKWNSEHKPRIKDRRLKSLYGISLEQYEAMYVAQDGKCAICERPFDVLCVDHEHDSKVVRSLLCHDCNVAIGRFNDDRYRLSKAIEYLTKHQSNQEI